MRSQRDQAVRSGRGGAGGARRRVQQRGQQREHVGFQHHGRAARTTTFTGTNFTKNVPVKAPGVTSTTRSASRSITSKTNPLGSDAAMLQRRDQCVLRPRQLEGRDLRPQAEADEASATTRWPTTPPRPRRCSARTTSTRRSSRPAVHGLQGSSPRPGSPRSAGTSTRSGPGRTTSSRTSRRSASRLPAPSARRSVARARNRRPTGWR